MLIRRILGVAAVVAGLGVPALAATQYFYDDLGRLWIVGYDNGMQITYNYDAAGNRTQVVTQTGTALPPTANPDYVNGSVNTATSIYPLTNDTDPNTPPLTLTITAVPAPPANGTAAKTATKITYTPTANFVGNDSFTYTITNGTYSSTATVYVSVIGCPQPPNAVADNITTKHGIADSFDPRTNDSDPCGFPLEITTVTQPNNGGSVSIIDNRTELKYTPPANWNGTETFSYTVGDGHGQKASATVSAADTGVDNQPVAVNDKLQLGPTFIWTPQNGNCSPTSWIPNGTLSPMANDSDPDGDKITIASVGKPSKGTATNNGDGTVTYTYGQTVTRKLSDTDSFSYQISDGYGGYASATVSVTITVNTEGCG